MIGIEASEDDNQTNQNTTYKVSLKSFMYIHNGVNVFFVKYHFLCNVVFMRNIGNNCYICNGKSGFAFP